MTKPAAPVQCIFHPIGIIHSEHKIPEETPIQPVYAKGCQGSAEIYAPFTAGLKDLAGFSHLYLLYHFHRAGAMRLEVRPFLQDVSKGIFATRAPDRPNPIGLSIVRLSGIRDNILFLEEVDILDGTPLLDIKPYTAKFDRVDDCRSGWQDGVSEETAQRRGKRGYKGDRGGSGMP